MRIHGRAVLAAMVVLAPFTAASTANAATTIGQSPPSAGTPLVCDSGALLIDAIQLGSATGNPYVVPPGGGVITRWRTALSTGTMAMKLRVFTGNSLAVQPVGESALVTVAPGGPREFFTRVPSNGGEMLGFTFAGGGAGCVNEGTPADADLIGSVVSGPIGGSEALAGSTSITQLLNIAADLEPDADRDGFGDESQDATITRSPSRRTSSANAKFRFVGSVSFQCKLDGGRFRPCTSPKRYRRLDSGRHRFQVRAVTPTNELSPAERFSWRVTD